MTRFLIVMGMTATGVLSGCAPAPKDAGFGDVRKAVAERTGRTIEWNRSSPDDRRVAERVAALLDDDLSVDQAVQIALLNNRKLQSTYEQLGIAQAELVQAGLLRNPVFDASIRFPDGGGKSNIEFGIAQNFIDLLALPLRRKVAAANFNVAKSRVANEVLSLASETEVEFYRVQAAQQMMELRRSVLDAASASFDAARRIHDAGNINDLDLANEQSLYEQAKLDLAQAEAEFVVERERLTGLMGLWGQNTRWTIAGRLPELPTTELSDHGLERLAMTQRSDLAASRQSVVAAAQSLGAARPFALVSEADIGIDTEREPDGGWVTGPNLSVPIPLFDRGQGSIARLEAELRQAQQRLYAQAVEIRAQVRAGASSLRAARDRASYYRRVVIPLRHRIVEHTQLQYNAMQVGVFQLLSAKQGEVDAGRDYVEALRDYWVTRAELARAVGGCLPSDGEPTGPISRPASPRPQGQQPSHQH